MRRTPSPRNRSASHWASAAECLSLGSLAQRARALDRLDEKLRHHLPEALARECRLANVSNGRLVFLASSAAWATRLRLHQTSLLAEARAATGDAALLFVVKVAALPTVPPEPDGPKPLSATAARHLRTVAKTTSDRELQALYVKLASLAGEADPPET